MLRHTSRSRRAILLLTDGLDTSSRAKFRDVVRQAASHQVAVFSIGLADKSFVPGSNRDGLESLSKDTGGRAFFPKSPKELPDILKKIAQGLRTEYVVNYCARDPRPDNPVKLKIEIKNPQLRQLNPRLSYRRYSL